jgi:hypothetical protein
MNSIDPGSWGEILVGIVGIVIAAALSVVIYVKQRDKRELLYQIEQKQILHISGISGKDIEIRFKDLPVDTLSLCSITIQNYGNRPIRKNEWDKPLNFSFKDSIQILDMRCTAAFPEKLDVKFKIDRNEKETRITFAKVLLNPRDGFRVDFLVSTNEIPSVETRIEGISIIKNASNSKNKMRRFLDDAPRYGFVMILLLTFLTFGSELAIRFSNDAFLNPYVALFFITGGAMISTYLFISAFAMMIRPSLPGHEFISRKDPPT